jgi:hypothetical protein
MIATTAKIAGESSFTSNPSAASSLPGIYDTLRGLINRYPHDISEQTKIETERLYNDCLAGADTDSQKLLATLFLKAFCKKMFGQSINEHIYLKQDEIPQIHLFDILIKKFPFVKFSQELINNAIIKQMNGKAEVTIIDIGIGLGTQMMHIVENAKSLPELKKLTIIGIEPFGDALLKAKENILSYQKSANFAINFIGIHDFVENVDFTTINGISGELIVNASLALHHIQSQPKRGRTIARIKALQPSAFILTEPNVNHFEPQYQTRFENCYNHFHHIFKVIDKIDIKIGDKNGLKRFFGREIEDIMGKEETDRYERHELATTWISRLEEAGFELGNDILAQPFETPEGVKINYHGEGYLGFTYEQETVLSVMFAR